MFTKSSISKFKNFRNKNIPKSKKQTTEDKNGINLIDLEIGKSAIIREFHGNSILTRRLKSLGIVPNTIIIKKSAIPAGGPIVVEKGSIQFAVGYATAENIIVDPIQEGL